MPRVRSSERNTLPLGGIRGSGSVLVRNSWLAWPSCPEPLCRVRRTATVERQDLEIPLGIPETQADGQGRVFSTWALIYLRESADEIAYFFQIRKAAVICCCFKLDLDCFFF